MKVVSGKTALWLAVTLLSVAVALGQSGARGGGGQRGGQQQGGATAGNASGATILQRACSNCHAADAIANHHFERAEEYRDLVNTMIDAGAQVTPQELPVLVDYLFATYGRKPAPGAPQATPTTDPGKAILDAACTTCHGLEGLANHAYDSRAPYESLIGNMIAYGATVTDAQVPVLADYLLKTYGKKPAATTTAAATPDPGKAILESACTVCHGLDGMANHNYTSKEPYESLAKSMVAYGAVVTDAQMGPLVDYMFKTYGKK
jgi:mono/diheme cytochrome c family protein